jgi:hypothetical protein
VCDPRSSIQSQGTPHPQQRPQPQLQASGSSGSGSNAGSSEQQGPCPPASVLQHVQELSGRHYSLVAADLRDIQQLKAALERAGFNPQ